METIRVILAEDQTLVWAGVRALLAQMEGIQVVAEVTQGHMVLSLVEDYQPEVMLIDLSMPGLNGLEATTLVAQAFPHVRILILSPHANEEYARQALQAGATGYLLKDSSVAELELALRSVLKGEIYLSPAVSKQATELLQTLHEESSLERLTPRQREVLQMIASGHTMQQIAQSLQISVKTVETHRAQLMERVGIYEVAGLVRYAIRMGLITSD